MNISTLETSFDHYCVFGNPIAHSRSPWIHTRFAELTGEAVSYTKRLAPLHGFAQALNDFRVEGGRGCNITVPFKLQAAALANQISPRATLAGACNVLNFVNGQFIADNSDGIGLVRDLTLNAGLDLKGCDILLIGAGGAAAGVLGPLLECQPRRIVVANRTLSKAQALVNTHTALALYQKVELCAHTLQAPGTDFDLVINGTASSLSNGGIPVPSSCLRPGSLACDLMYGPAAQGFMDWAAKHGAQGRDGLGMLVEQAGEAFEIWRGIRPPTTKVLAELQVMLAAA